MYTIDNLFATTDLAAVRIGGSVGHLLGKLIEGRITSQEARDGGYREAEDAFKNRIDDQIIVGYWQGEFWGKWVISAARVCRHTGDRELAEFLRQGCYALMSYQREDGYIGTYKDSLNMFACDRQEAKKVVGWECNWNWNVWCRKYTLWGLMECYLLLKDPKILDAACRHASHLIKELRDNHIRLCDTGTFNGLPSGSIIKPMLLLWETTGDQKYLDFSIEAAGDWDRPDGRCPNLIANARSGKPVHEWYPESQTWAKAYEMMSCLDGLLELYRVTGKRDYFEAVEAIYERLLEAEYNTVFSVGFNDIFGHAANKINAASEPCDVIHWLRVSYELFMLTGKSRYLDLFELAFYNSFLAGVYRDGKWGSRGVRSAGRHITALQQAGFTKNHCCVNNLPRGFMNMAQAIAVQGKDGIRLNLFSEAEVTLQAPDGKPIHIRIGGDYLQHGLAEIEIDNTSADSVPLFVRIPVWSRETTVRINGKSQPATAGEYLETTLAPGATRLEIQFDRTPSLCEFPHELEEYGPKHWAIQRWTLGASDSVSYVPPELMAKERMCTLRVGPLLLARSKRIGNTVEEMFGGKTVCGKNYRCKVTPFPMPNVRCGFQVEFVSADDRFSTTMCDYASAGNEILDDEAHFNIYV